MPSLDFKFAKNDELSILFYIYNTGSTRRPGSPT